MLDFSTHISKFGVLYKGWYLDGEFVFSWNCKKKKKNENSIKCFCVHKWTRVLHFSLLNRNSKNLSYFYLLYLLFNNFINTIFVSLIVKNYNLLKVQFLIHNKNPDSKYCMKRFQSYYSVPVIVNTCKHSDMFMN